MGCDWFAEVLPLFCLNCDFFRVSDWLHLLVVFLTDVTIGAAASIIHRSYDGNYVK